MALPPTDVSASELLLKLIERPQPTAEVDYPAKSTNGTPLTKIRIGVLRGDQIEEATFRGKEAMKSRRRLTESELSTPYGEKMIGDAVAKELLAMACFGPTPIHGTEESGPSYPLLFRSANDVNKLPPDEITALFGAYLLVQKKFGPYEREMTDDEVNAWIERLEVGASELPLSQLASHQLVDLCLYLARRASCLSRLLTCQRQNLPINWESIPDGWAFGTSSSFEPAADDTQSSDDTITAEQAMEAAKRMIGR